MTSLDDDIKMCIRCAWEINEKAILAAEIVVDKSDHLPLEALRVLVAEIGSWSFANGTVQCPNMAKFEIFRELLHDTFSRLCNLAGTSAPPVFNGKVESTNLEDCQFMFDEARMRIKHNSRASEANKKLLVDTVYLTYFLPWINYF